MPPSRYASLCAVVLLCGSADPLHAQRVPANAGTGQIQVFLDGGPFHADLITLQQTGGDWFASPTDAHASLTFTGSYKNAPAELNVQWNGRDATHVIDEDHNSDSGGDQVTFFLRMDGEAPLNISAAPRNEDLVTVNVSRVDEVDLQAALSGTVTSSAYNEAAGRNAVLQIHAMIVLHRARAPVRLTTGAYTSCDNVIWDKFVGTQDRSPSECEVKFDADVRGAVRGAFEKVTTAFGSGIWQLEPEEAPDLLKGVAKGTEKTLFDMAPYVISARMNPQSAEYQGYRARYDDLTDKMRREVNASLGTTGPAFQALRKLMDEVTGATRVGVTVRINQATSGFVNFTAEHRVLQVPGAAYAVAASRVAAPSGGGIDESLPNVTYVYLGSWKPATFEKLTEGGERMRVAATPGASAPLLSVQNIVIRIECNPALTDAILRQIDFPALQKLLPK